MINFLIELKQEMDKVITNNHLIKNMDKEITYPYLTYQTEYTALERNVDEFYIDVDVFDNQGNNYMRLFQLEDNIKKHFTGLDILTDDLFVRFGYLRGHQIETQDDVITRRNIQLHCKVNWRK